jgi:hypothetical protein
MSDKLRETLKRSYLKRAGHSKDVIESMMKQDCLPDPKTMTRMEVEKLELWAYDHVSRLYYRAIDAGKCLNMRDVLSDEELRFCQGLIKVLGREHSRCGWNLEKGTQSYKRKEAIRSFLGPIWTGIVYVFSAIWLVICLVTGLYFLHKALKHEKY